MIQRKAEIFQANNPENPDLIVESVDEPAPVLNGGGLFQFLGHKSAVRIFRIRSERLAISKTVAFVQASGGKERIHRTRLQAQSPIAASPRFIDDMLQQTPGYALPQMSRCRAHRFDLAMTGLKLLQRAAAEQLVMLPSGPERDVRPSQPVHVQRVHAFRRRTRCHLRQMFQDQRSYFDIR